jgi:hypothetical protein
MDPPVAFGCAQQSPCAFELLSPAHPCNSTHDLIAVITTPPQRRRAHAMYAYPLPKQLDPLAIWCFVPAEGNWGNPEQFCGLRY